MSFVEVKVMIYFDRSGCWLAKSVLTKFATAKNKYCFQNTFVKLVKVMLRNAMME